MNKKAGAAVKNENQEIAKKILLTLGVTAVVASVMVFPGLALMWNWIDKEVGNGRSHPARRSFYMLKRRGMILVRKKRGKIELLLTEKGKKRALGYKLSNLTIQRPRVWDEYWRLVMFDVPEGQRSRRDMIRLKLRQFNFLPIQKSVFIHPYPCLELIESLRDFYQLAPGQLYIFEARVLEGEAILKKRFGL